MRKLLILTLLLAVCLETLAQNVVKGRVVEADGTPVIYAAVMLDSGNKTEAGVMTEKDGTFRMNGTFKGNYLLTVSSIRTGGYPRRVIGECRWERRHLHQG